MAKINYTLNLLSSIILLSGLAGCSSGIVTAPAISPIETQQGLLLPTPSSVSGDKPSPTNTNQPHPESLITKCIKLDGVFYPPVETTNHVLLLRETEAPYSPYLLNLANGTKTPILGKNIVSIYVSPNQDRFAYNTYSRNDPEANQLVVANASGEVLKSILMEKNWSFFWGWLSNNYLMVTKTANEDKYTPTLVVLGLLDDSRQEVDSEYPSIDNINYASWQHNRVVYNPTLTLALYPSFSGETSAVILYDIRNENELASISVDITRTAQPEWSPDGNYIVVAGAAEQNKTVVSNRGESYDQDLFLISKNGNVTRLTNFTAVYNNVRIGSASWSPNGKIIAFWFSYGDSTDEQLATVNLDTMEIVNYCITGIDNALGYSRKPVWSPNNRFLLVNNKEKNTSPNKVLWIDINNLDGATMEGNMILEGWLISK